MKRYFALLSGLSLLLVFVFSGCETPTNETGIPALKKVVISDSTDNLANGIEQDTFTVGDTVYFAFSVTDSDLDIKQVVILQKSDDQTIDPVTWKLAEQYMESYAYGGDLKVESAGNWTIQAYLVDAKGNVSNTVTRNIIVNDISPPSAYTITFYTNGGSEVTSILDVVSGSRITQPGDPEKLGHTFDGWYIDDQYHTAWDFDHDVITGNIVLYAKWIAIQHTVSFYSDGAVLFTLGVSEGDTIAYRYLEKAGYYLGGWYTDGQYNESWDFDNDVVTDNIALYAKWLNIPPGEVVITDCLYNVGNSSIDVYYTIPGDVDLDHIIVYVDGVVYYDPIPTDYIAVYLYNISNGAVVTIKTVDTAGLVSNGVDHTVNIPGYTPVPNLLELVLSADVIRKYPDRLEPSTISCLFETYINNEYMILHNIPTGWRLSLSTSAQSSPPYMTWNGPMPFEAPIPIDRSWTWVEFKLYKDDILFDSEKVLIVSDGP
jgi:uncharacterized repeat protein (TIGR02543 family)